MKNNLLSFLILIVIVGAAYMIVQTLRTTTQAAAEPFQALGEQNRAMQTQVANLLHPTPTIIPDPVTYINDIRALSRLETIQYSVEKVENQVRLSIHFLSFCFPYCRFLLPVQFPEF